MTNNKNILKNKKILLRVPNLEKVQKQKMSENGKIYISDLCKCSPLFVNYCLKGFKMCALYSGIWMER